MKTASDFLRQATSYEESNRGCIPEEFDLAAGVGIYVAFKGFEEHGEDGRRADIVEAGQTLRVMPFADL